MANGILSDSELEIVTGGLENVGEDIYSYYGTCEDWTCEVCHKRCSDKCHICENGSISRADAATASTTTAPKTSASSAARLYKIIS